MPYRDAVNILKERNPLYQMMLKHKLPEKDHPKSFTAMSRYLHDNDDSIRYYRTMTRLSKSNKQKLLDIESRIQLIMADWYTNYITLHRDDGLGLGKKKSLLRKPLFLVYRTLQIAWTLIRPLIY